MGLPRPVRIRLLGLAAVVVLAGAGVAAGHAHRATGRTPAGLPAAGAPAPEPPAAGAPGGGGDGDQSEAAVPLVLDRTPAEAARSLATLRRLDDHPLYEMTYYGAAPRVASEPAAGPHPVGGAPPEAPRRWSCTVFAADGDPSRPLLGRNFDWDANPAMVLYTDPPDGYASMSVVDISYLGFDAAHLGDLSRPDRRGRLLEAPRLPFDGMNERGLAIGMAAEDNERPAQLPGRPTVGSVGIMRLVLDHAGTVPEAARILSSYNIDFSGGPRLHYLVADATGAAAVVEWVDGQLRVQPRTTQPWQLMVNFQLATSTPDSRAADWRYRTGSAALTRAAGRLDPAAAMHLLGDVAQGHTRWSIVYDLAAGRATLVTDKHYQDRRELRLPGR